MAFQFTQHYSRDEARALLPQVRQWLKRLNEQRRSFEKFDQRLGQRLAQGNDLGGNMVNEWITGLSEMKSILQEFQQREIQIKDIDRGLIDFPAIIGGREVFLCWEQEEEDIEFWHDLETGYAGREKL